MGLESVATVRHRGTSRSARVLLETDELRVRGDQPLRIRFAEMSRVEALEGALVVEWGGDELRIDLGAAAATWAERIRSPRSLLDKLGVKAGETVDVVGDVDAALRAELASRAEVRPAATASALPQGARLVVLQAAGAAELSALEPLARRMARDGAVWVVHPKGRGGLADTAIFAAAKEAGLAAVKVARVSDALTAEKLVIPKDRR